MTDFLSVFESLFGNSGVPKIEKVIFNDPATIVFWVDGSKTVVKTMPDQFDDKGNLIGECIYKSRKRSAGIAFAEDSTER